MITLDGISLTSDLLWIDEYAWTPVAQQVDIMSDGAVAVQEDAQLTGRLITLIGGDTFGYVKKSVVDLVKAKADTPGLQMTLVLNDGRSFNVVFTGDRYNANPVADNSDPDADFYYTLSLYLMVLE